MHRSLSDLHESLSLRFSKSVANWKSSDSIPVKLTTHNPYGAAIQITYTLPDWKDYKLKKSKARKNQL